MESPESQDGLVVKVDGARVPVKRAFAYSDGPKTMVLMTNNAAMECGTYFEPGRGYGPDEKHVWLWLDSSGGAWKVWGVMVENRSTNGDGLGTVRSTQGTPNDEVHADLEVDARIPPPPQSKEPSIALEIDGKLIAVGCGKNPAAL